MRLALAVTLLVGCSSKPVENEPAPTPRADAAVPIAPAPAPAPAIDAAVAVPVDAAAPLPHATVIDRPMAWSARRAQLTLDYRRQHSDPGARDLVIEPRVIVLHYTAGGSAKGTLAYFDNIEIEAARPDLARAGRVNVSAHYLIDRDGVIYRAQPETRFARHCIGLNHLAIGIENVGDEKRFPLTQAQVIANANLIRDLAARFPITHVLGHYEVMKFRDHPYYVERDPGYRNTKPDPGARFMREVRARIADLSLAGLPN